MRKILVEVTEQLWRKKSKNNDRRYYLDRYIKLTNVNTVQAVPLSDQQSISLYQKFANDLIEKEKALKVAFPSAFHPNLLPH